MTSIFLDSVAPIAELIDKLVGLPVNPPSLYFDLEGIRVSREGSVSIFQLFVQPENHVYLIDIHVLGKIAFTTKGAGGQTLKGILESAVVPKVCFDVRNDSDALYSHYGIAMQGIQDIQLMENASRLGPKNFVNGLRKCIEYDAPMTPQEKQRWKAHKDTGRRLFDPKMGGSYQVFNDRPLKEEIRAYCVQDVQFLPKLREIYWNRLGTSWKAKVNMETRQRVWSSQQAGYQSQGKHKTLSPWRGETGLSIDDMFDNALLDEDLDLDPGWADDLDNDFEDWTNMSE